MSQLKKLKLQLDITDDKLDDKLNLLLDDAEADILGYCQRDELPFGLYSAQRELAIIRYNKEGVEGQTSHSEGGISRSWGENDIPQSMKSVLNQYRLAKVVGYRAT